MLESLHLQDFQPYARLSVDFDPHATVFVGESDAGKSSILRAIRWLATNRPRGEVFVRHGSDGAKVRLTLDGGRKVVRAKGKENLYKLDGARFAAFGADVPADVASLLNVGEVNFQGQLDPPFWFALSPGEVSKQLNKVVDLDLIDKLMASLAAEHRKAETEAGICETRLKEAEGKAKALEWVPECEKDLRKLETAELELKENALKRSRTADLLSGVRRGGKEVDRLRGVVQASGKAVASAGKARFAAERAERIEFLLTEIVHSRMNVSEAKEKAKEAAERLAEASKGKCPVCGKRR